MVVVIHVFLVRRFTNLHLPDVWKRKGRNNRGKGRLPVEKTVNPVKFGFAWMLSGLPCLMLTSSHFLKRAGLAFVPLEFKHNF